MSISSRAGAEALIERLVQDANENAKDIIIFRCEKMDIKREKITQIISGEWKTGGLTYNELCAVYLAVYPLGLPDPNVFFENELINAMFVPLEKMYFDDYLTTIKNQGSKGICAGAFTAINEGGERVFHKRFLDMNAEEIINAFENSDKISRMTIKMYMGSLLAYVEWCQKNNYYKGVHSISRLSYVNVSLEKSIKRTVVKTPKELADLILDSRTWYLGVSMPIHLCLYWLGLENSEISDLKITDIDFNNKAIPSLDITNIPNEFLEVLQKYIDDTERSDDFLYVPFKPKSKAIVDKISKERQLSREILLLNDKLKQISADIYLTASSIRYSGALYTLRKIEMVRELEDKDFRTEFKVVSTTSKAYSKLKDLKSLYSDYKLVFNL